MAERMPDDRNKARAWLYEQELSSRKNERMIDKIMGALPRELSREQQDQLVRDYAERMTQGKASWFAAIHREGKDADNPHMHLIIRDRDPETGKKVAQLSSNKSTERVRAVWEQESNRALEEAGRPERIDRRSLKDQGIDREPTVHVGPKAGGMHKKGHAPKGGAPVEHEPVGTDAEKAVKRQKMRSYREVSRAAYNAQILARLAQKHAQEKSQLQQAQAQENAIQKSQLEADELRAAQRLEATGLKRLVRNVFGKTRQDQEARDRSQQARAEIEEREADQQAALARQQTEERDRALKQRFDHAQTPAPANDVSPQRAPEPEPPPEKSKADLFREARERSQNQGRGLSR